MSPRLTIDEAAAELRKTRRWLLEWLRAHPRDAHGELYYTPVGRDKIFHPNDITRIESALRGELQCRSNSGRRAPAKRRIMKSAGRTSESEWKLAAELTNDHSLSNSFEKSKSVSRSTDNTRHPHLSLVQGNRPS
jgi:hypothetical protein